MKRFAAVALREIAERRFVLVAAAAAAVIPFLVPLLPGVPGDQGTTARSITALILSSALGLGGSLLVGASVVGRELAEKRLSFHFSRPLSAPVIWGGKVAGGLTLVLAAELLVYVPTSLASGVFPGLADMSVDTGVVWAILLSAVPLFFFAWLGSVALRSRSPWLVVDLFLLFAIPAAGFLVTRRFLRYGGWVDARAAAATGTAVLLGIFLAATFAQAVVGRTDARRGHGAQSLTLWGLLLAALAAGALWAERTIDPGVERLARASATPAGSGGDWVFVDGSARRDGGGSTTYLLNLKTRQSVLVPLTWTATVSADGSRAAYVSGSPFSSREIALDALDLATGESVSLDLPEWPDGVDLTSDGRRLAVVSQGICRVLELPSLKLLASARVPSATWSYEPHFVSPDLVRLHPRRSWKTIRDKSTSLPLPLEDPVVAELQVARKSIRTVVRYPVTAIPVPPRTGKGVDSGPVYHLVASPDLSRVLLMGFGSAHTARLLDAASGRVLASFDGSEGTGHTMGVFLADGRVVVAEAAPEGRRLTLLSPDGAHLAGIALPAGTVRIRFGFEPARGLLGLGLARNELAERLDGSLADLESGLLRPLGCVPLPRSFWSDNANVPPPGSPATRLAWDESWRLVLYDPETGAQTPLTRGQPRRK